MYGCRALSLICKFATGPLWRFLESSIHIRDMNKQDQITNVLTVLWFACWCILKILKFLKTMHVCFAYFTVKYSRWINQTMFRNCIWKLMHFHKKNVRWHVDDGKYSNLDQQLMKETVGVSATISIAERNFWMLDRFIREKPNANMITYGSMIMSRTNKTPKWQHKLTPQDLF